MQREGLSFHWFLCALWPVTLVAAAWYGYARCGGFLGAGVTGLAYLVTSGTVLFLTAPRASRQTEAGRDVKTGFLLMAIAAVVVLAVWLL